MPILRPLAALILVAPLAAQTMVIQPAPGARVTETRTLPLAAGAPLRVHNVNGHIRVTGWDRNEVEFTGAFTPGKHGDQVKVVLEPKGGGLAIQGVYPNGESDSRSCDMDLKVPRTALASLENVNGDVTLSGVAGKAECRTVNGGIDLDRLQGAVRAQTVNGGIKGRGLGSQISAKTVNGGISLSTRGLRGRLEASTVNGELSLKGENAKDVHLSKHHFEATFGEGGEPMRLETVNGDITLD